MSTTKAKPKKISSNKKTAPAVKKAARKGMLPASLNIGKIVGGVCETG
jgi:hypothetical protein